MDSSMPDAAPARFTKALRRPRTSPITKLHALRNRIETTGLNRRRADPAKQRRRRGHPMLLWIFSSGGACALSGALGLGHVYELDSAGKGVALIVSVIRSEERRVGKE